MLCFCVSLLIRQSLQTLPHQSPAVSELGCSGARTHFSITHMLITNMEWHRAVRIQMLSLVEVLLSLSEICQSNVCFRLSTPMMRDLGQVPTLYFSKSLLSNASFQPQLNTFKDHLISQDFGVAATLDSSPGNGLSVLRSSRRLTSFEIASSSGIGLPRS
jgi:hypothetical protein